MTEDLLRARTLLEEGDLTLAIVKGRDVITDSRRGVLPLYELIGDGKRLCGYSAADRVVGKAAAMLYVLLGVEEVWAGVVSEPALAVFRTHEIRCGYGISVPHIINRTGDGFCPMETAVSGISSPREAYAAIGEKLKELANGIRSE